MWLHDQQDSVTGDSVAFSETTAPALAGRSVHFLRGHRRAPKRRAARRIARRIDIISQLHRRRLPCRFGQRLDGDFKIRSGLALQLFLIRAMPHHDAAIRPVDGRSVWSARGRETGAVHCDEALAPGATFRISCEGQPRETDYLVDQYVESEIPTSGVSSP